MGSNPSNYFVILALSLATCWTFCSGKLQASRVGLRLVCFQKYTCGFRNIMILSVGHGHYYNHSSVNTTASFSRQAQHDTDRYITKNPHTFTL